MNGFWTDVRSVCRSLIKARGFFTITVVTLGTGFTLCFTVLTIANAFLIRPLPYPAADRLYSVEAEAPGLGTPPGLASVDWSPVEDVVQNAIGWDLDVFYIRGRERTEAAPGAWVTAGFLPGLSVRPSRGRAFEEADFAPGAPQAALISDRLWERRFGRDPNIVGSALTAYVSDRPDEAEAFTIVGVLPADFWHVNIYTDVLTPLRAPSIPSLVRLREGVAPVVAAERMTALAVASVATAPPGWHVTLTPLQDRYLAEARPILSAVATASALALLIACANVAVLLLVRGTRRRHEISVRLAVGASRGRIARMLVLEALMLGVAAAVVGLAMSGLAIGELGPVLEGRLGRRIPGGLQALTPDRTVVVFGILLCLATVVACALAPLVDAWRLASSLATNARSATDGPRARRTQSVLVAVQVGASLTLLAGSSLMLDSSLRMLRVDFGFRAADIESANVRLRQRAYPDAESREAFFRRLLGILRERTGQPAAAGDWWPLQTRRPRSVEAVGVGRSTSADLISASSDYFAVLGLTIVQGTTFDAVVDRPGGEAVAVVSATLASRLWPGTSAVGQRLRVALDTSGRGSPSDLRVVGVVNDVRGNHADSDMSDLYVPWFQRPERMAFVYLNGPAAGQVETLRTAVAEIDAEASVGEPLTLDTLLDLERVRTRLLAWLLSAFGLCAALLALVGIYGAVAYSVRHREREIGLRMALGAAPGKVAALFIRQGSVLLFFGLVPGVLGALAIGRVLQSQRFGSSGADPFLIAGTAAAFAACGLLATWWPARRASRIDPAVVLKDE